MMPIQKHIGKSKTKNKTTTEMCCKLKKVLQKAKINPLTANTQQIQKRCKVKNTETVNATKNGAYSANTTDVF